MHEKPKHQVSRSSWIAEAFRKNNKTCNNVTLTQRLLDTSLFLVAPINFDLCRNSPAFAAPCSSASGSSAPCPSASTWTERRSSSKWQRSTWASPLWRASPSQWWENKRSSLRCNVDGLVFNLPVVSSPGVSDAAAESRHRRRLLSLRMFWFLHLPRAHGALSGVLVPGRRGHVGRTRLRVGVLMTDRR